MAVFSSLYPSILYFVKTIHECQNIKKIPATGEPSYVVSDFLEVERAIARGDFTIIPSNRFMKNHLNSWIILLTTECYDVESPTSNTRLAIEYIIKHRDCTRVFFITQHQMQTDYVLRHYPSLNITGTYNEWETFSYIQNKYWAVKDTSHYVKRFAFINRRNDQYRSMLFYHLWNLPEFPQNTFASFNPGNYWDTMGRTGDDITQSVKINFQRILNSIDNSLIVDWFKAVDFPQLPPEYSEPDPVNYNWHGGDGLGALMRDTGISIVAETVTYTSGQRLFATEKIFRPIVAGQPFITLASQGFLRNLRSLGYKTFGDIWDEGYDDLVHVGDRTLAIRELVGKLNSMTADEFRVVLEKCQEVCAHNREVIAQHCSQESVMNNVGEPFKSQLNRNPHKYKYARKSRMV